MVPSTSTTALWSATAEKRSQRLVDQILKNYTRLALINTEQYDLEHNRDYSRCTVRRFGLHYE